MIEIGGGIGGIALVMEVVGELIGGRETIEG